MKRMCQGRGLVLLLVGLAGVATVLLLLVTGRSGREATAQEADGTATEESIGDQIRRLMTEGENPQAAIAVAVQYLAAHPETTLERQRVHYELAAAQWFAGDHEAALATFRQIVVVYANSALDRTSNEYRVDNALYFVGVMEGGNGNRAAEIAAYEALIAQFPQSDCRPRAMLDLGAIYIADGKPERGLAMLQALVAQHPKSGEAPAAIRDINAWLLRDEASPDDETRAANVAAAKVNVGILTTKYATAIETAEAWQRLLDYHAGREEFDAAKTIARQMIAVYFEADPQVAGDALWSAATTLLDHAAPSQPGIVGPTPASEERAIATAALVRFVAQRPGAECPPQALYRLACVRAEDGDLVAGRALAESLTTRYAGTDLEPEALAAANGYWLSKEANPTKADRALNYERVKANMAALVAKFPDSPETLFAHEALMWHFENERFDYAEAEVWARRMIELFPDSRSAVEGRVDLAEIIVLSRRDFAAAYPLIDEALAWAYAREDWGLVGVALHVKGRLLNREKRYAEAREVLVKLLPFIDEHPDAEWLRIMTEAEYAASYIGEGNDVAHEDEDAGHAILMKAAEEYAAVVERHPDDPGWTPYLKHQIGFAYMFAGEMDKAKAAFIRLVTEHPNDPWSWCVFDYMDLGLPRPERPAGIRFDEEEDEQ